MAYLQIENLQVNYGAIKAVQGVSFSRALMPFQAKGSAGRRGPFGRAALDACPPAPHIVLGRSLAVSGKQERIARKQAYPVDAQKPGHLPER